MCRGRAPYLAQKMKGMTLISLSKQTDLSSLSNRDVVPVLGIFHGSHAVSKGTVQALFGNIRGVTTTWGDCNLALAKHIDHVCDCNLALAKHIDQWGIDPSLWYRIDYMGVSNSRQPTTSKNEDAGYLSQLQKSGPGSNSCYVSSCSERNINILFWTLRQVVAPALKSCSMSD